MWTSLVGPVALSQSIDNDLRHLISNCNTAIFMHSIVMPPRKMKLVYELDMGRQV